MATPKISELRHIRTPELKIALATEKSEILAKNKNISFQVLVPSTGATVVGEFKEGKGVVQPTNAPLKTECPRLNNVGVAVHVAVDSLGSWNIKSEIDVKAGEFVDVALIPLHVLNANVSFPDGRYLVDGYSFDLQNIDGRRVVSVETVEGHRMGITFVPIQIDPNCMNMARALHVSPLQVEKILQDGQMKRDTAIRKVLNALDPSYDLPPFMKCAIPQHTGLSVSIDQAQLAATVHKCTTTDRAKADAAFNVAKQMVALVAYCISLSRTKRGTSIRSPVTDADIFYALEVAKCLDQEKFHDILLKQQAFSAAYVEDVNFTDANLQNKTAGCRTLFQNTMVPNLKFDSSVQSCSTSKTLGVKGTENMNLAGSITKLDQMTALRNAKNSIENANEALKNGTLSKPKYVQLVGSIQAQVGMFRGDCEDDGFRLMKQAYALTNGGPGLCSHVEELIDTHPAFENVKELKKACCEITKLVVLKFKEYTPKTQLVFASGAKFDGKAQNESDAANSLPPGEHIQNQYAEFLEGMRQNMLGGHCLASIVSKESETPHLTVQVGDTKLHVKKCDTKTSLIEGTAFMSQLGGSMAGKTVDVEMQPRNFSNSIGNNTSSVVGPTPPGVVKIPFSTLCNMCQSKKEKDIAFVYEDGIVRGAKVDDETFYKNTISVGGEIPVSSNITIEQIQAQLSGKPQACRYSKIKHNTKRKASVHREPPCIRMFPPCSSLSTGDSKNNVNMYNIDVPLNKNEQDACDAIAAYVEGLYIDESQCKQEMPPMSQMLRLVPDENELELPIAIRVANMSFEQMEQFKHNVSVSVGLNPARSYVLDSNTVVLTNSVNKVNVK